MILFLVLLFFQMIGYGESQNDSCWLEAPGDFRDEIATFTKQGSKLIYINVELPGHHPDMLDIACKHVHRPYQWIRAYSRQGRSLLMLDENYKHMSLSTLTIGVETMYINLTDSPPRCLKGKGEEELIEIFRKSFLRGLVAPQLSQPSVPGNDEHICNMQVLQENKQAVFRYRCCRKHQDGQISCEDMHKDEWIKFLLALVIIIKVLVILCSPMFIPETLYREKFVACPYIFHVPGPAVSLKVVVTQRPEQYGTHSVHKKVRLSEMRNMENFKTMVSATRWEHDKIYEVKVPDIRLSVKSNRLLSQNKVPVTVFKLFYNSIFRCRIRHLEPLNPCCHTNILGKLNPGVKVISWYRCMKIFASFLFLALLSVPWFIRMAFYYVFEAPVVESKMKSADSLGVEPHSVGNVILYLSPVHALFIIIYVIFIIDSLVLGIFSTAMKEKLKTVVRQCLRDMKERPKLVVIGWMTKLIVKPFTYFGVVGFIFFIPYFVIIMIVALPICAFYIFPTLNLSIRLIIQFFIFVFPSSFVAKCKRGLSPFLPLKQELKFNEVTSNERFIKRRHFSTKGIILQLLAIFMCLITFWSLTLLVMESCSFFVELLVYTFMGLIVNAGVTLQYFSQLLLVLFYARDILDKVHNVYLDFHKVIHKELLDLARDDIKEVAKREALDQENTVFSVKGEIATNMGSIIYPKLIVMDRQPCWLTQGMLVFLDKQDTPYTPEQLFYHTIDLNYYSCPGPVYRNVGNALIDLIKIIFFLLFVVLVVMAFGDAYSISSTNQLLATVVGGVLPYVFGTFFNKQSNADQFDTSSIQFKTEFHKAINAFCQTWPVHDIVSSDVKAVVESRDAVPANEARDRNDNTKAEVSEDDDCDSLVSEDEIDEETPEKVAMTSQNTSQMTSLALDDAYENVDLIVDISTPKTRKLSPLVAGGFEKGSETMLNGSEIRSENINDSVIEV